MIFKVGDRVICKDNFKDFSCCLRQNGIYTIKYIDTVNITLEEFPVYSHKVWRFERYTKLDEVLA